VARDRRRAIRQAPSDPSLRANGRDAFRKQRDQAYGEIDDLCRERNELMGQLERLIAVGPASGGERTLVIKGSNRSSHRRQGSG
jgi:hypothetical protein